MRDTEEHGTDVKINRRRTIQTQLLLWNCHYCGNRASDQVFDIDDWYYSCGCFEKYFEETGEHL